MKNVQKLIEMRGGLEALGREYIRIEAPGFRKLLEQPIAETEVA